MRVDNGLSSTLQLLARHKIWEQRIPIHCSENYRTRWAEIEPSANSRVGVGLEKQIPFFLIAHSLRKIRIRFGEYKHTSLMLS
jgi:hypothetical protein